MVDKDVGLMAHLMRRAGFGALREELESRVAKGYEATVEELLDPASHGIPSFHEGILFRHFHGFKNPGNPINMQASWMYRMINTPRPLEEKMVLFWHQVFATGYSKVDNGNQMLAQIDMFRCHGLGSYQRLLTELSKDPAMIFWLDNNENHKEAPNENWGRELLELFSMGQGNYTEQDVKECARAFTGWTIAPKLPRMPYGRFPWEFEYRPDDHDDDEKTFLGHKGRFNGEDIIDIIMRQPATARFIARHLYNFFVADEVQVPSWQDVAPRDPVAIDLIGDAFISSGYDIRSTLRVLFNSDFFKDEDVWFGKVKSPAELISSTIRLVGDYQTPKPGITELGIECAYQGQSLLDPPSVEGWHTGGEWIDSGALLRRINFVADRIVDTSLPGVKAIIDTLAAKETMSAEELVEGCLELMGPIEMEDPTRQELVDHVLKGGPISRGNTEGQRGAFAARVTETMQLIASTREYQFG
ncbi:MAG: DUF1800 domain-containing protein [Chloroflexi bacterium]|nr:DUF1800 domain-containing protein [Chloroflexota bacterium]